MLPEDPLNTDSDWVCEKTGMKRSAEDVKEELSKIGLELEVSVIASFIMIILVFFSNWP